MIACRDRIVGFSLKLSVGCALLEICFKLRDLSCDLLISGLEMCKFAFGKSMLSFRSCRLTFGGCMFTCANCMLNCEKCMLNFGRCMLAFRTCELSGECM
jgi:hypothetical protein